MSTLRIIDVTTGEDRTQEYSLVNRKQAEGYKRAIEKEQYRLLSQGKNWVASYHDPIREVITGLTLIEAGAIIKLLLFLRFKSDGKLIKNGKPLKVAGIFKLGKIDRGASPGTRRDGESIESLRGCKCLEYIKKES